jgi:ATP phosphoribosyltransferase
MSEFEKKLLESADTIYLPNRYQEPFIEALGNITNIKIPDLKDRKLSVKSNGQTFRWVRGRDVPQIVASVQAAQPKKRIVGLSGSEWCDEYMLGQLTGKVATNRMIEYYNIPFAKSMGRVAIIAPQSVDVEQMREKIRAGQDPVPVITVYPNLAKNSFKEGLFRLSITTTPEFTLSGGVESLADDLGMLALDLVCTGATVIQNNFTILAELQEVYPAIVTARGYDA